MFVERICVVCTSNMWYACAVSSDTSFGSITECLFIFFSCLFFLFRFHLLIRIHIITSLWFSFGAFMFIYFFLCISSLKVVLHCLDTDYDLFVYVFLRGRVYCFILLCHFMLTSNLFKNNALHDVANLHILFSANENNGFNGPWNQQVKWAPIRIFCFSPICGLLYEHTTRM